MTAPISILIPIIGGKDRAQAIKNEMLIESRLDAAIETFHATQPPAGLPDPVITDHPIDPELQTGESLLLGGAMQISAPWTKGEDDG